MGISQRVGYICWTLAAASAGYHLTLLQACPIAVEILVKVAFVYIFNKPLKLWLLAKEIVALLPSAGMSCCRPASVHYLFLVLFDMPSFGSKLLSAVACSHLQFQFAGLFWLYYHCNEAKNDTLPYLPTARGLSFISLQFLVVLFFESVYKQLQFTTTGLSPCWSALDFWNLYFTNLIFDLDFLSNFQLDFCRLSTQAVKI